MSLTRRINRRAVLQGVGASLALPWLEAMSPLAMAAGVSSSAAKAAQAATPRRMAFFYVPNGVHMQAWKPKTEGKSYELPDILEPLASRKDDLLVLSGLAQVKAFANGDGPGDHARSLASFLTGVQALKTDGANIRVGQSVDQVAAQSIGKQTRFGSLELGIDRGPQSGNCDSGYSCTIRPTSPGGRPRRRWPKRSTRVSCSNACSHPTAGRIGPSATSIA